MERLFSSAGRWLVAVFGSLLVVSALSLQPAGAVDFFGDVCEQDGSGSSEVCNTSNQNNISGANGVILRAANLIAIISAIAAVIMIMVGGFNMITGGGDTSKVSTAKKTIIYAVVGLIVIALARTIVGFVVTRVG